MASKFKVYKKKSPNGQLTVYLSHRDFLEDEGKQLVPVAGVVQFREEDLRGDQLFCMVNLSYRYGQEEDETMAMTFQRTLQLINAPLFLKTAAGKTLDQEGEDAKKSVEDGCNDGKTLDQEGEDVKNNVEDGGNEGKVSGRGWKVKILGYDEELMKEKEMEDELARWRTKRMEESEIKFRSEMEGKVNEIDQQPRSTTDKKEGKQNDPERNGLLQQEGNDKQMNVGQNENKTTDLDKHERTDGESDAAEERSLQMKEGTQTASSAGIEITLEEKGEKPLAINESEKENLSMQATEKTNAEFENKGNNSDKGESESKSVEENLNNSEQYGCIQELLQETENKEESNGSTKEVANDECNETSLNKVRMVDPNQMSENDSSKSKHQKDAEAATDVGFEVGEEETPKGKKPNENKQNESEAEKKDGGTVGNVTKISVDQTENDQTTEKSSVDCTDEKVSNDEASGKKDDGTEEIVKTESPEKDIQFFFDADVEKTKVGDYDTTCKVKVTNETNQDDCSSLHEENLAKSENEKRSKSYPSSPQPHLKNVGKISPPPIEEIESVDHASSVGGTLRVSPQPSLGGTQQHEANVSRNSPCPSVEGSQHTPTPRNSPQPSINDTPNIPHSRNSPQPSVRGCQDTPIPGQFPLPSMNENPGSPLPRPSPQHSPGSPLPRPSPQHSPGSPLPRPSPQHSPGSPLPRPSPQHSPGSPLPRPSPQHSPGSPLPRPSPQHSPGSPLPRPSPQHSFGGQATPTPRNSPQPSVRETEGGQYLLPGDQNYRRSPQPSTHSVSAVSPTPSAASTADCNPEPTVMPEHRCRGVTAHPLEEQMATRARLPYSLPVPTPEQLRLLAPPDAGENETAANRTTEESDSSNSQSVDKPRNDKSNLTSGAMAGDIAYDVTVLQTRLMEKLRASSGGERCVPFTVEVPKVAPNSVTLVPGRVASNNPVGIIYELQVYAASEVTEAPPKYKSTSFAVRKLQLVPEDLEAKIQCNVSTKKKIQCSPGHVELSITLDKDIYFHGESISAHVTLDNASRKTVKSVRCDVVQHVNMTITKTHFSRVVTSVESRDGCPVQPTFKFSRTFQLIPDVRYNKTNVGAALIGQFRDADSQLASSTLPLNDNSLDEALGIVVSYSVRVTLLFGAIRGEMHVEHGITVVNKRPEDYVGKRKASIMEKLKALTVTDNVISIEDFAAIRRLKSIEDSTGP